MRVVADSGIPVPGVGTDLEAAFERVFGPETLKHLYGPDVHVGEWRTTPANRTRRIRGAMRLEGAPAEVVRFLGGGQLRATTHQDVTAAPGGLDVSHRVRMHFLGAEFVRVRPSFRLRAEPPGVVLDAEVRVSAMFPPPLGGIVESFMQAFAARQLAETRAVLARKV